MTQQQITLLNLGSSLDDLANLDPRGYGVCKLLYKTARELTGEPLCLNAAKKLARSLEKNDIVYIMTGFVLHPFKKAETDGAVGSVLLARALMKGFGVRSVIVCPDECVHAIGLMAEKAGLRFSETVDEMLLSGGDTAVFPFTKDSFRASEYAERLISKAKPTAVISIECPGENEKGVYHNATGIDVTSLEAKQDVLFDRLSDAGILNIAIGDLGNEIGMGTVGERIKDKIPYAAENGCRCGCRGGILARTKADNIITATVSDWGCCSLIAMLAYMLQNVDIMHDELLEKQLLAKANEGGLIDMTGKSIPAVDGFTTDIICPIVTLMKELVRSTLALKETCKAWFDKAIELKSFE